MRVTEAVRLAGLGEDVNHALASGRVVRADGTIVHFRFMRIIQGTSEDPLLKPGDRVYVTAQRLW